LFGSIYQKKIILKEQIKLQSTIDELLEKAKREAIEIKKKQNWKPRRYCLRLSKS